MKISSFLQMLLQGPTLLCLLLLVLLTTRLDFADAGHLKGVVGGHVTFYCPVDETKQLQFLYFQKVVDGTPMFLNGYHYSKPITPEPEHKTKMERNNTMMHMYGLTLSHSGFYQCYFLYKNEKDPRMDEMQLEVTAIFSEPEITVKCTEESGIPSQCRMDCNSYNGLAGKSINWNFPGNFSSEMWKNIKNSETPSSGGLVNISSSANFNCSGSEVNVSCSIDGLTSDVTPVCSHKALAKQPNNLNIVIVAVVVCLLAMVAMVVVLYVRKSSTGTNKGAAAQNAEGNEEDVALNDLEQGQSGS